MFTEEQILEAATAMAEAFCTHDITLLIKSTDVDAFGVPIDKLVPYEIDNVAVTAKGLIYEDNSSHKDLSDQTYALVSYWNIIFGLFDLTIPNNLAGVRYDGQTFVVTMVNDGETDRLLKKYTAVEHKSDSDNPPPPDPEPEDDGDEDDGVTP